MTTLYNFYHSRDLLPGSDVPSGLLFRAPLLPNDSSSPALYIKVLGVASPPRRYDRKRSFTHPFFVLKVGSNFTVTPAVSSPELLSSEFRLPTLDSAGQQVPRILKLYLYGYKASKVRLMGIGRFSVDRIMESIHRGAACVQVSVGLLHRNGGLATTVLLALRSDECARAIPYAVVSGGDEGPSKVQAISQESGGSEAQYVVVSAGGDMAIGVVEEVSKVDVVKRRRDSFKFWKRGNAKNSGESKM